MMVEVDGLASAIIKVRKSLDFSRVTYSVAVSGNYTLWTNGNNMYLTEGRYVNTMCIHDYVDTYVQAPLELANTVTHVVDKLGFLNIGYWENGTFNAVNVNFGGEYSIEKLVKLVLEVLSNYTAYYNVRYSRATLDVIEKNFIANLLRLMGREPVTLNVPTELPTAKHLFRVVGRVEVGGKWLIVGANANHGCIVYATDMCVPSDCYVVPVKKGEYVYYTGALTSWVKAHKIVYVARKLRKKIVTLQDIEEHWDVKVGRGIVHFGKLKVGIENELECSRIFTERLCGTLDEFYQLFVDFVVKNVHALFCIERSGVWLGKIKVTIAPYSCCGNTLIQVTIDGVPVYVLDLADILLKAKECATYEEFMAYVREASKKPLFPTKYTVLRVKEYIRDDGPHPYRQKWINLPITYTPQGACICGRQLTLEELAVLLTLCEYAPANYTLSYLQRMYSETLLKAGLYSTVEYICKQIENYSVTNNMKTLEKLLASHPDLLKKKQIHDVDGIVVKGKLATYFVTTQYIDAYIISDDETRIIAPLCVCKRKDLQMPRESLLLAYVVTLLNDAVTIGRQAGSQA